MNSDPHILIISSVDPTKGPGTLALDIYKAFKNYGLRVDLLTKFPVSSHPEFLYVQKKKGHKYQNFSFKLRMKFLRSIGSYCFFYTKEIYPPVKVKKVLKPITKHYDIVYIVFWQDLLTFATIEKLYDKLKSKFYFCCVDYSPMSGGCHFNGNCNGYKTGCGACPGIQSSNLNDFTRWNVLFREKVYEKVKPIVLGNTYMRSFFNSSYLLKNVQQEFVSMLINIDLFKERDKSMLRKKYEISSKKKFIIFWGSQSLSDERKGVRYLMQSLLLLHKKLSLKERESILLLLAGNDIEPIKKELLFDYKYFGYVATNVLPDLYSLADISLSPSINDAGPSMVNQSLACGTPVVSYDIGTALDVIKNKGTGYCAKLKDSEDFTSGILNIFRMDKKIYYNMRQRCREVALKINSEEAFINSFFNIYNKPHVD